MKNVLWIVNKYVHGTEEQAFYPRFLQSCQEEMRLLDFKLYYCFYSNKLTGNYNFKDSYRCDCGWAKFDLAKIEFEAERIEREYSFTFKQAYYPDLIQTSKYQNNRLKDLPEKEFEDLKFLVLDFLNLEKLIIEKSIDICFCDDSPEYQMEFARAICLRRGLIFLKYHSSFLARCVFSQQFEFGSERIVEAIIDNDITIDFAKNFINTFVNHKTKPYYILRRNKSKNNILALFRSLSIRSFFKFKWLSVFHRKLQKSINNFYYIFEEIILKKSIEDKFDVSKKYLFFGLHLPTESTLTLRSLPYLNQISLIESISRVLPYGVQLVVREHPSWRAHFPFKFLLALKKFSNVRLITPKIPIHEVVENSIGVVTYNSTTGIEALMYGKPVLSFSPNVYYRFHPAVYFCTNLYSLGSALVALVNTKVLPEDSILYIKKLFSISSDIQLGSDFFYDDDDVAAKSKRFSKNLANAVNWCESTP